MTVHLLKYLALPPLINVLLIVAGLLLLKRWRWLGSSLVALGLIALLALSTPLASYWLRVGLETYSPPTAAELSRAEAIVILGGGRDYVAPEFGWGDAPNNATWRRLAYGAWLADRSDLPILVTGGRMHGEMLAEATLMAKALRQVFGLEAHWIETRSRTTAENARYSAPLLKADGIRSVLLVSQAWHLPRAVPEFTRMGLEVIPAPTDFASPPPASLLAWIPQAYHLRHSAQALHEWLGRAFYALRAWLVTDETVNPADR
nr:YdcF family protein [uncultured Halomonas sp.]